MDAQKKLDPWQELVLARAMAKREDGTRPFSDLALRAQVLFEALDPERLMAAAVADYNATMRKINGAK